MTKQTGTRGPSTARKTTKPKTTRSKATKSTTTRRTAAASAPKVEPKLVEVKEAVVAKPAMRKKELIDLVVERSGAKKKDAKPAIEAVLAVLGEALADGRELNLRPFGKLKISRQEQKVNGSVIVCRIRQPKDSPDTDDTKPSLHAAE